ncbi:BrnT family toxin [Dinoroseobacter sp. PD6]|nr:BrnT family toxin [Dinoroseobacter sp. PD6]MDD9718735.1 BrnT family toxin [Dinoroseobacter sp. PD6]
MSLIRFTWDEDKNLSNQRKHSGVSFELAARVFEDPFCLTRQDRIEDFEQRWQTIGIVHGVILLLVAHTVIEEDSEGQVIETIRIISARKADRSERKRYEEERG